MKCRSSHCERSSSSVYSSSRYRWSPDCSVNHQSCCGTQRDEWETTENEGYHTRYPTRGSCTNSVRGQCGWVSNQDDSTPSISMRATCSGQHRLWYLETMFPVEELLRYILEERIESDELLESDMMEIMREPEIESYRLRMFSSLYDIWSASLYRAIGSIDRSDEKEEFIFEMLAKCILVLARERRNKYKCLQQKIIRYSIYGELIISSHRKQMIQNRNQRVTRVRRDQWLLS